MSWAKHCICLHPIICFLLSSSDTQLSGFSAAHLFLRQEQVETPALGHFSGLGTAYENISMAGASRFRAEGVAGGRVVLNCAKNAACGCWTTLTPPSCGLCEPPFWREHHSSSPWRPGVSSQRESPLIHKDPQLSSWALPHTT